MWPISLTWRPVRRYLEACSALGSSAKEALAEVERAKRAWIEAAQEAGRPIPEPHYRPAIYTR